MRNPQGTRFERESFTGSDKKSRPKRADMGYIMGRLWGYLGRHRLLITLAVIFVVAGNLLQLLGPSLSGKAIDAIGKTPGGVDFNTMFYYAALMIVFYIISGVMAFLLQYAVQRITRSMSKSMRQDVFERLTTLPVSFFDSHQTGDIISVISYDIDTVNASFSADMIQIARSVITVVGSLIMMLTIEPLLVLVFVVTVPLSVLFSKYISNKVRPLYRKRSASLGQMNGFAEEMIQGQKTTRAYNCQGDMIEKFDRYNENAVIAYKKAEHSGTLMGPSVNFINNISLALVSVFGALLYMAGGIGLGDISSFVLYSRKFSGPINEVANIFGELQSAFAAAERVFRLIDELPEKADDEAAEVLRDVYGDVLIKNVDFGYEENKPIITDLCLSAKRGSLIAIVGPTGAGKTTIINLLMRFYDADSGEIKIDGKSIYGLTRESLRLAYTMVLQDTWLFSGTIFENIAYAKENATMEEVVAAAKAAKIHSYITRLPDGYNTYLSDNGSNISKGQKQLLTIARAMLHDSKMLILDEATSNVDTQTERQIQSAMRELMRDRTCFVIAHRLSTIQHADLILVLKDGNVVEQGTHDTLIALGGVYSELYRSQFE